MQFWVDAALPQRKRVLVPSDPGSRKALIVLFLWLKNALSTNQSSSSPKSPQLSVFCFLWFSNSTLYTSCLLEGSKRSHNALLRASYIWRVSLVSHMSAMWAFSVNQTRIHRPFSSSFHLFIAVILSKWLITSLKFPVPSNFSSNTSGRVVGWRPAPPCGGLLFSLSLVPSEVAMASSTFTYAKKTQHKAHTCDSVNLSGYH